MQPKKWAKKRTIMPSLGNLVGLGRVELPTSRLSGVRSSHLSYRPTFTPSFARRFALVELTGVEPATS